MLCVIAIPDPEACEKLSMLRETVLPPGRLPSPFHAHITVAAYLPEDTCEFLQSCIRMFRETRSFTVRYDRIEVLPETSVIVAAPSASEELSALHGRIIKEYAGSLDRWTHGELWYPHTTLIYDPEADLHTLCRDMRRHFVPFEARIGQIEFSRVENPGFTILEAVRLL